MHTPAWLTAQPIAHRGLHDRNAGIVENTSTACKDAVRAGFAIECDVQITADGEAVVFHDFTVERLTKGHGRVDALSYSALADLSYQQTDDRILSLTDYINIVGGRVPLIIEIKSRFDNDLRLAHRVAELLHGRSEPIALMSFDPYVMEALGKLSPQIPRGMVVEADYGQSEWSYLSAEQRIDLTSFLHVTRSQPDFIAWRAQDFPHPIPSLMRYFKRPVLAWTIRTLNEKEQADRFSDQIIFEGFRP